MNNSNIFIYFRHYLQPSVLVGVTIALILLISGCASEVPRPLTYTPIHVYKSDTIYTKAVGYFEKEFHKNGVKYWLVGYAGDDVLIGKRDIGFSYVFQRAADLANSQGYTHLMLLNKYIWGSYPSSALPTSYGLNGQINSDGTITGTLTPNYSSGDFNFTKLSFTYGADMVYLYFRFGNPDCSKSTNNCATVDTGNPSIFDLYVDKWYECGKVRQKYRNISNFLNN